VAPPDYTKDIKGEGSYLVGVDIAPGVWRSGGSNLCPLELDDLSGKMIHFKYDPPGSTFRIPAGDYQVEIMNNDCTWTFLKP
jgi:hypothetical protein